MYSYLQGTIFAQECQPLVALIFRQRTDAFWLENCPLSTKLLIIVWQYSTSRAKFHLSKLFHYHNHTPAVSNAIETFYLSILSLISLLHKHHFNNVYQVNSGLTSCPLPRFYSSICVHHLGSRHNFNILDTILPGLLWCPLSSYMYMYHQISYILTSGNAQIMSMYISVLTKKNLPLNIS